MSWEKVGETARKRFLEEAGLSELPEVLGLHHTRLLDRILTGEVVDSDALLRDLLQKRNNSILAHGLAPIDETSAIRFLDYANALVEAPEARIGSEHARIKGL